VWVGFASFGWVVGNKKAALLNAGRLFFAK
jgi:hypothetical protein